MTNEEAIKIIGAFEPDERLNTTDKLQALIQALSALEKQVPLKCTGFKGKCTCDYGVFPHMDYCSRCGQALKWEKK